MYVYAVYVSCILFLCCLTWRNKEWINGMSIFQQEGALAHRTRFTVWFLKQVTSQFISPDKTNSPIVNPVDYSMWYVMEWSIVDNV